MTDIAFGRDLWALRPALVRVARNLCKDAERADDLASDAIARAWEYRRQFTPGTNLAAWVTFILRNRFLTEQRRKRWDGGNVEDHAGLVVPCPPAQEHHIHLRDMQAAFEMMPREQVEAVIAIALEDGSYEEAAESAGVPVGTMKSRIARGRAALQELMA